MDEATFNRIYTAYRPYVRKRLHHHRVPDRDAPDVEQDVWIRIFRNATENINPSYVCLVIRSVVIDRYRKELRSWGRLTLFAEAPETPYEDMGSAEVVAGDTLQRLISRLPTKYKVRATRMLEDESPSETARVTGIAENTCKVHYFRTRQRMRDDYRAVIG